jgi:hypothetical protein
VSTATSPDGSAAHLFGLLRSLDLPAGDYAVFGSGPLLARGVIDHAGDLDVLCRGAAWEHAQRLGPVVQRHGMPVIEAYGGLVTLGICWGIGSFDTDHLIDTAEVIDDLPFVRLEHVVAYKRLADRRKDREHLRMLEEYRANG